MVGKLDFFGKGPIIFPIFKQSEFGRVSANDVSQMVRLLTYPPYLRVQANMDNQVATSETTIRLCPDLVVSAN